MWDLPLFQHNHRERLRAQPWRYGGLKEEW